LRPLKYDPRQNVVRMTKIPINVSRPLKYDSKQNVVRITKIPINVNSVYGHTSMVCLHL
jgi:hypothetical protein